MHSLTCVFHCTWNPPTSISSTGTLNFGGDGVVGSMTEQAAWVLNGINSMTLQSQVTNIAAYVPTGGLAPSTTIISPTLHVHCILPLYAATVFSLYSATVFRLCPFVLLAPHCLAAPSIMICPLDPRRHRYEPDCPTREKHGWVSGPQVINHCYTVCALSNHCYAR
jgi:hypothetical protein